MDNWTTYSWTPDNSISGGRKKHIIDTVPAGSRKEAVEAFLNLHPEEAKRNIGASRAKSEQPVAEAKKTTKAAQKASLKATRDVKRYPLYKKLMEKIALIEDTTAPSTKRQEALSYLRGAGAHHISDKKESVAFTEFAWAHYLRLREIVYG